MVNSLPCGLQSVLFAFCRYLYPASSLAGSPSATCQPAAACKSEVNCSTPHDLAFPEVLVCLHSAPHDITLQLCMCLPAAGTLAQQAASLAAPLDILVATPQKVLQHAQKGNLFYGDVQWLVLDEADTMLDRWAVT